MFLQFLPTISRNWSKLYKIELFILQIIFILQQLRRHISLKKWEQLILIRKQWYFILNLKQLKPKSFITQLKWYFFKIKHAILISS